MHCVAYLLFNQIEAFSHRETKAIANIKHKTSKPKAVKKKQTTGKADRKPFTDSSVKLRGKKKTIYKRLMFSYLVLYNTISC